MSTEHTNQPEYNFMNNTTTSTGATAAPAQKHSSIQSLMNSPAVMAKISKCLGTEKKAAAFASSVISIATGSPQLRDCNPTTILGAAMVAATLDLPIVPTLGMAYIVPYKGQCQFQIGYKGLIELAERSGVFRNIIDEVVYEGQLVRKNKFTGEYVFDEDAKKSDTVIGYMARFDLTNGFSKTVYWSKEEVEKHARRFSQAYSKGYSTPWSTDYDTMARKTVLKALFAKYAPKSISYALQTAITFDQSVSAPKHTDNISEDVLELNSFDVVYADNDSNEAAVEARQEAVQEQKKAVRAKKDETPKLL